MSAYAALTVHYSVVLRVCLGVLGDADAAEDAAQETFRRALQQDLTAVGDEVCWLKTVARNVCIDELRRRRRVRTVAERSMPVAEAAARNDGADPERVVVGRIFVGELLNQLTPAERRVVTARLIDDRSGPEVAAALGVAPVTTRVLLMRALGKLRHYLAEGQGTLGGAAAAGWKAARRLRNTLLLRATPRSRVLTEASGPQGVVFVQGVAALLTAAIAGLWWTGGATPAEAAPGRGPVAVAQLPLRPVSARSAVPAVPAARAVQPAAAGVAPPRAATATSKHPSPPPPSSPTSWIPQGPIAQSYGSPQQGIHLVGPVYLEVGPGPGWWQEYDSLGQAIGISANRCGVPVCIH